MWVCAHGIKVDVYKYIALVYHYSRLLRVVLNLTSEAPRKVAYPGILI